MDALVVGGGGREHTLALMLSRSPGVRDVYVAPGNAGVAAVASTVNLDADDAEALASWAAETRIEIAVVCAEMAVRAGVVGALREAGVATVIGATPELLEMCTSPTRLQSFLQDCGISAEHLAQDYMGEDQWRGSTDDHPDHFSVLALVDGQGATVLGTAQRYHRLGGEDSRGTGVSTEGLGAISPAMEISDAVLKQVQQEILQLLSRGFAAYSYRGPVQLDLRLDDSQVEVMALLPGWGDPDTQAILPRLQSDLLLHLIDAAEGRLSEPDTVPLVVESKNTYSVAVTLISEGYPDLNAYETGYGILGLAAVESSAAIFHEATRNPYAPRHTLVIPREQPASKTRVGAGFGLGSLFSFGNARRKQVQQQGTMASRDPYSSVITAGGRVITVVGMGTTRALARDLAYRQANAVTFTGRTMRIDIGHE